MAKKKRRGKRLAVLLSLDPQTWAALTRYVADHRIPTARTTRASVGLAAVIEFLSSRGYLPPAGASAQPD